MVSCLLFWPHLLKTTVDETMFVFLVSLKNQWRLTRCLFLWSSLSNLYLSSTFTNWTEGTPMFWVESSNNYTLNTCWFFGSRLARQDISSIMSELLSGISKTNDIDLHVWSISLISQKMTESVRMFWVWSSLFTISPTPSSCLEILSEVPIKQQENPHTFLSALQKLISIFTSGAFL